MKSLNEENKLKNAWKEIKYGIIEILLIRKFSRNVFYAMIHITEE